MRHHIRRGVRRDGTPWVVAKLASSDVLIKLVMPNDPEFHAFDHLALQQEAEAMTRAIEAPKVIA